MRFWAVRSIVVTVIRMLREAAAAGPLLSINPTTGGGAAWVLGLKAWLGIRRFELAGALVVRQRGYACPALRYLRRRGRTHPIGRMVVRFELAVGPLQGQSSIGRLGLVTLNTLVYRGRKRLGHLIATAKRRPVRVLGTFVNETTRPSRAHRSESVLLRMQSHRRGRPFIA